MTVEWLCLQNMSSVCKICHKQFASKYSQKRHMDSVHISAPRIHAKATLQLKTKRTSEPLIKSDSDDDDASSVESTDSTRWMNKDMNIKSRYQDNVDEYDDENEQEEEEEENVDDFWTLLIRETVRSIKLERKSCGEPVATVQDSRDLLEGKELLAIIDHLKGTFYKMKCIVDASENDKVADLIQVKIEKLTEKFDESDLEDMIPMAANMAWKKYRCLVKKKISDNIGEFDTLIEDDKDEMFDSEDSMDDSEDDTDDNEDDMDDSEGDMRDHDEELYE